MFSALFIIKHWIWSSTGSRAKAQPFIWNSFFAVVSLDWILSAMALFCSWNNLLKRSVFECDGTWVAFLLILFFRRSIRLRNRLHLRITCTLTMSFGEDILKPLGIVRCNCEYAAPYGSFSRSASPSRLFPLIFLSRISYSIWKENFQLHPLPLCAPQNCPTRNLRLFRVAFKSFRNLVCTTTCES